MSSDINNTNNLATQRAQSLETLRLAQTNKTKQQNTVERQTPVKKDKVSLSKPALFENISKIQGFLDDISYGQQIVKTALENINSIIETFEEIGGLAIRAGNVLNSSISEELKTPQITEFQSKAANLSDKISNLVQGNGFEGKNLLKGDIIPLTGTEKSSFPLTAEGVLIATKDLGLDNIQFRSTEESDFVKNLVLNALDQVSLFKSQLNGFSFELDTRKEFSETTIETFIEQAQKPEQGHDEANALNDLQYRLKQDIIDSGETLGAPAQVELLQQFI